MRPVDVEAVPAEPRSGAKPKGAPYGETLQTTGCDVVRIVIVPREPAPISSPPLRCYCLRESVRFPDCVFQARRNLSVRCGPNQNHQDPRVSAASRWSAPEASVKRRDGRSAPWLIVRDEFRTGYSLIGLLASRARLRFTGERSLTCTSPTTPAKGTFLLCTKG
jgi:hypothetical protein